MASAFQRAVKFLSMIEDTVLQKIYFRFPPESFTPALVNLPPPVENSYKRKSLTEILQESSLWAVPKRRRSVERRRCRRFGVPKYFYKPLLPKTNILICSECGSYKEAGLLCPNCYSKIKAVTTEMQEVIEKKLGISPVESEVVVLYSNDEKLDPEFYKGKRIIEMEKERPKIFCDNLLQKSTQDDNTVSHFTAFLVPLPPDNKIIDASYVETEEFVVETVAKMGGPKEAKKAETEKKKEAEDEEFHQMMDMPSSN